MPEPITLAALSAGSQLLGGLLQQRFQAAQAKKDKLFAVGQQAGQQQLEAQQALATGQQNSLQRLIESYRSALQTPQI